MNSFKRDKHVYKSKDFEELIKDILRFFSGTPVHQLPPPTRFHGTGIYAIYYIGDFPPYQELYRQNRTSYNRPIYIGKAVPRGWRQARIVNETDGRSFELYNRLNEHSRSINHAKNLDSEQFSCRFMILENEESNLIGTVEAAMIRQYIPLWNTTIDGFGNHDPGSGRYNQAKSDWDIIHPGRQWAEKCLGKSSTVANVKDKVAKYFDSL